MIVPAGNRGQSALAKFIQKRSCLVLNLNSFEPKNSIYCAGSF